MIFLTFICSFLISIYISTEVFPLTPFPNPSRIATNPYPMYFSQWVMAPVGTQQSLAP